MNYKIFGNLDKPNSEDIRNEKPLFSPFENACFFYEINSPYFKFTSSIAEEYGWRFLLECLLNKKYSPNFGVTFCLFDVLNFDFNFNATHLMGVVITPLPRFL